MVTEMELGHRIRDLRKKKGLSQLSFTLPKRWACRLTH